MARTCVVTGKGTVRGNHVAHCNKKQRRSFKANIQNKRFYLVEEKRWVRLPVSGQGMRIIDKVGIETILAKLLAKGIKF